MEYNPRNALGGEVKDKWWRNSGNEEVVTRGENYGGKRIYSSHREIEMWPIISS